MARTYLFVLLVFLFAWICLIETSEIRFFSSHQFQSFPLKHLLASGAAGWCYQCNSRETGCQLDLDAVIMANNRVPCNGQCYIRVKDGRMSFEENQ